MQIEYQGQSARDQGTETVRNPEFEGVSKLTLSIAVRGSGRLELDASNVPRGWQKMDWSAVPGNLQNRGDRSVPALCFRVAEPEGPLVVAVQRHDLADALKVRITKGDMTTIFSPSGPFVTQAVLNVNLVEKSAMRVRLPQGAQLFNAFVNGVSVPVVREEDAYLFNVAPGTGEQHEAAIRMVYAVPQIQHGGIELYGPVLDVPMENVSWRVVVPAGFDVANYHGDLRLNEQEPQGTFGMAEYPLANHSPAANAQSKDATAWLEKANTYLQNGATSRQVGRGAGPRCQGERPQRGRQ